MFPGSRLRQSISRTIPVRSRNMILMSLLREPDDHPRAFEQPASTPGLIMRPVRQIAPEQLAEAFDFGSELVFEPISKVRGKRGPFVEAQI